MFGRTFALIACLLSVANCASREAPPDTIYARPGILVPADGTRLNFYCMGSGSPAVVFDSGWEDWSPDWMIVQPRVAAFTRACAYDRAGNGFSDPGPMPRTNVRIAGELHTALHNAGIAAPYILLGHAFGGDNVRAFADRYTRDVAGLVLVESDPFDLVPADMRQYYHRAEVRRIAELRHCRDAVAEGVPNACTRQFFRDLPEAMWSPQLNAELLHIAQTKVALYDAVISEMAELPWDEAYLKEHRRSLGSRPIVVVSTGNWGVDSLTRPSREPTLVHLRDEYEATLAQSRWLALSSNAKQVFAKHSSEYVNFDEPDTVVSAIRDVYDAAMRPGTAFRDCDVCPEMVVIPAGRFTMGSSQAEKVWAASLGAGSTGRKPLYLKAVADEAPEHTVSLRAFALGKYDVTRDEFAAFVHETGYSTSDGCGGDSFKWIKQPKLNRKVGRSEYRLPTESEWEYAARAGRQTRFWWGDDVAPASAYAWYKDNSSGQTHPVGNKPSNAFRLYDMAGNVWQWTQDCYAKSYVGAPADGRANEATSTCLRVDRGGSWLFRAWLLRCATRERNPADYRDAIMGFRIARTLP